MGFRSWLLKVSGEPLIWETEKYYKKLIKELTKTNREKDSHIKTLEAMLESNERRHVQDMLIINNKLDSLSTAYKEQTTELATITKELLWQREESKAWRERLEMKMEMDGDGPGKLAEIEKLRKADDKF